MENSWCYSYNGENFTGEFETKEDAIGEAKAEYEEGFDEDFKIIYVGQAVKPNLHISADTIIDELAEQAHEECGEYAESYLNRVDENAYNALEKKLNELTKEWMKQYKYEPHFYSVKNIEKIKID